MADFQVNQQLVYSYGNARFISRFSMMVETTIDPNPTTAARALNLLWQGDTTWWIGLAAMLAGGVHFDQIITTTYHSYGLGRWTTNKFLSATGGLFPGVCNESYIALVFNLHSDDDTIRQNQVRLNGLAADVVVGSRFDPLFMAATVNSWAVTHVTPITLAIGEYKPACVAVDGHFAPATYFEPDPNVHVNRNRKPRV